MNKNRKIIIVCLVILLVILLSIVLYNIFSFSNETDSRYVDKTIRVCRKDVQCGIADLKFNFIKSDVDSSLLQEKIEEVNKKILRDYRKVKKSDISYSECGPVASAYQHRTYIQDVVNVYEDSDYYIFSLRSLENNFCTDISSEKLNTYFYDKKSDRFITEERFREIAGINDSMINNAILNDISSLKEIGYNYVVDQSRPFQIFLTEDGGIYVYYYDIESNVGHSVLFSYYFN